MSQQIPLEVIQIAEPCPADWERMQGDDRSRYCLHCKKHVFDLSEMTRDEAERLVCEAAGSLCARFARDEHGTVITLDYAPAKPRRKWPIWVLTGLAALVAGALGLYAEERAKFMRRTPTMGVMCLPSPTPGGGRGISPSPSTAPTQTP